VHKRDAAALVGKVLVDLLLRARGHQVPILHSARFVRPLDTGEAGTRLEPPYGWGRRLDQFANVVGAWGADGGLWLERRATEHLGAAL
jgi:hypothetical protein